MLTTTRLARIGVVVRDLDQAVERYETIFGISNWVFTEAVPVNPVSYGRSLALTPGSWRSAIGSTQDLGENNTPLTFELIQPSVGESPFNEFLLSKGEGICFLTVVADGDGDVSNHFACLAIRPVYSAEIDGVERTFYDTRKDLGGFLVEMVTEANPLALAAPSPAKEALLKPQKMYHFGVLVDEVLPALERYRAIFGIQRFEMKTWQTEFGRLDDPMYRGQKVNHGYFTAQGTAGDFGFEIIQMKHGPSHYNREFFDERGPGIHHIFPWLSLMDEKAWDQQVARMDDAGYPVCMGSTLRGEAAEFCYFDTFKDLGGYVVEAVVRRHQAKPEYMQPDWIIDYRELQ